MFDNTIKLKFAGIFFIKIKNYINNINQKKKKNT